MLPKQPDPALPSWMNQGEAQKLAGTARDWFSRLGEWAQLPLKQLDPMTCSEQILDLLAWQRDIERFHGEPLNLYRLRVRHAYANARDAGSVDGFNRIFQRLNLGTIALEERMKGMDWDIINIILSDAQLGSNEPLLDNLIRQYGRTCRRYGWKVEIEFPVAVVAAEVSNETITETASIQILTGSTAIMVAEFSNDHVTEHTAIQELTGTTRMMVAEFSNNQVTESVTLKFITDTTLIGIVEFSNDQLTIPMEVTQ